MSLEGQASVKVVNIYIYILNLFSYMLYYYYEND